MGDVLDMNSRLAVRGAPVAWTCGECEGVTWILMPDKVIACDTCGEFSDGGKWIEAIGGKPQFNLTPPDDVG
jgi:hypothetical protein